MSRILNALLNVIGAVLVAGGIALLAFVAFASMQSSQGQSGRAVATSGGTHIVAKEPTRGQTVAVRLQPVRIAPGAPPVRILIPAIGVDSSVSQTRPINGIWNVANWAVGHLSTTPGPGLPGNGAYAAHDDIKGEIFKRLQDLRPGDLILLYTADSIYRYVMTGRTVVDPSNVAVLDQTRGSTITLITCTPYWVDTQRLVVRATLKSSGHR